MSKSASNSYKRREEEEEKYLTNKTVEHLAGKKNKKYSVWFAYFIQNYKKKSN